MLPKVSVQLCACYGEMVKVAIQCFLNQDYAGELELVVLDNNKEGETIERLLPLDSRIVYARCGRASCGKLRNQANALATGDVICQFDCDDWSASNRVSFQVGRLLDSGKAVTGFHNCLFYDMTENLTTQNRFWKYFYEQNFAAKHPPYSFGSAHCYLKSFWESHPFIETSVEDWPFTQAALWENELDSCDAGQLLVCRAHRGSLSYPQFGHMQFPQVGREYFPQEFFDAIKASQRGATQ